MSDWIYDEEGLIMKKMVGVMPLWDDEKESIWMLPAYMEGLKAAGMDSFIFPMTQDEDEVKRLVGLCDQILLTGGHDVNPSLYQEEPVNASVEWNETRDVMEERVISHALAQDMPVLGICRGLQILNVALGGTLYQDMPLQHPSDTDHHMTPPYDRPVHTVRILRDTPLYDLLQTEHMGVNSIHHQAIRKLAPDLREMALSEEGLVEAVYMPGKRFVWAVQWHPEYGFPSHEDCRAIFRAFSRA